MKKKRDFKYIIIIGVLAATGWFLFQQKPDVRSTTVTHTDGEYRLWVEVNANRWTIENREQFAEKLLKMVDENTFQKVHFSEDWKSRTVLFSGYISCRIIRTGHLSVLPQAEKGHASLGDTCPRESFIMFQNLK